MTILAKRISWTSALSVFAFLLISATSGFSQEAGESGASAVSPDNPPGEISADGDAPASIAATTEPPGGTRIFGFLPNYRTVDESSVTGSLTTGQKFHLASRDSFDVRLLVFSAALAGIGHWSNSNPVFGQGVRGFGKRLGTNVADQAIGNIMAEGLFPSVLHEDPRYYRRGTGSVWARTGYAVSRIFVTHTDSGKLRFNYSEWSGNAAATAISNVYYSDGRNVGANAGKLVEQCGLDALGQVLKEFWPDIKRKFFEHSEASRPRP